MGDVRVVEASGLTTLEFETESRWQRLGTARRIEGVLAPPGAFHRGGTPQAAERYEGMLVSLYNGRVVRRGLPQGSDIYAVAFGADTVWATDRESAILPPDSTFFVRPGDRLGRLRGIVVEDAAGLQPIYVLRPRIAEDYQFVFDGQVLTTWGSLKHGFR
ncbi:MAG: hypothetical protein GF330_01380 [Candidatus Eisenbacteria bacterium]|nr:hypothetical protein [Candidatus Eisenbacteria bacterium]